MCHFTGNNEKAPGAAVSALSKIENPNLIVRKHQTKRSNISRVTGLESSKVSKSGELRTD